MSHDLPWPAETVFIEVGAPDARLASALDAAGYTRYLGTCESDAQLQAVQQECPALAGRFVQARDRKLVLHNNAEVLILSQRRAASVWKFRDVRHARFVAWRVEFRLRCLWALLGCLCHVLAKRYGAPRLMTLPGPGGGVTRLLVSKIKRHRVCHRDQLHFVPHALGLDGLFDEFERRGVRYVVLRWFDELADLVPHNDVDFLVADESLSVALEILSQQPGIQQCDVYSETGLPRSTYCGVPYYPAHVARQILEGSVRHERKCRTPGSSDYFHSLAYHAVYHKGDRCGLAGAPRSRRSARQPSRNYATILRGMASQLGIAVDIELEALHLYLRDCGWGPSDAELARLAEACPRNRWLQFLAAQLDPVVHAPGLAVFVLREKTVTLGLQDKVIDQIEQHGFEILATKFLDANEIEYAAARTRGGDWSEGPYEAAAGPPAACIVVYDPAPLAPNRKQRKKFPARTNARIFAKEEIREAVLAELPPEQGFNALHSSDHAAEAWHLIDVMAPELAAQVEADLRARSGALRLPIAGNRSAQRQAA